jgi:hypothetical protein
MLERLLESILVNAVKFCGGWSLKFVSPGTRGVPDRLNLLPVAAEHVEIVGRYVRFVEVKQKGQKPTEIQQRVHQRLRALGYSVDIVDSREKIDIYYPKP